MNAPITSEQKTLFIALAGSPNAGKSTLINQLVGNKISIVSPKVQTTRQNVRGIVMQDHTQLVLIDTPGIFTPKQSLEKAIVNTAWQGVKEAELIALLLDVTKGFKDDVLQLVESLKQQSQPLVLILNKIDKLPKDQLLALIAKADTLACFKEIFMVSALKGEGVDKLKQRLTHYAKPSPWCFDPEDLTDMPMRMWVSELVREQLYYQLQQELPYQITVVTEQFKEIEENRLRIDVTVIVNKESQKAIVLGKGGSRMKAVGTKVRKTLQSLLDKKLQLYLFVKVKEGWFDKAQFYLDQGMEKPKAD